MWDRHRNMLSSSFDSFSISLSSSLRLWHFSICNDILVFRQNHCIFLVLFFDSLLKTLNHFIVNLLDSVYVQELLLWRDSAILLGCIPFTLFARSQSWWEVLSSRDCSLRALLRFWENLAILVDSSPCRCILLPRFICVLFIRRVGSLGSHKFDFEERDFESAVWSGQLMAILLLRVFGCLRADRTWYGSRFRD